MNRGPARLHFRRQSLSWLASALLAAACGGEETHGLPTAMSNGAAGSPPAAAPAAGAAGGAALPIQPITPAADGGPQQGPDQALNAPLPCEVASVVSRNCGNCHGSQLVGGAPMPLVTPADFGASIKSLRTLPGETAEVAKLVKLRINDAAKPMPPGALLPEAERNLINGWLDRGHPAGAASDARCAVTQPMTPNKPEPPTTPGGVTCYQFKNHGQPQPGDTTPYGVVPGEHYVSFYYNAPWKMPSELVSWRTIYDNRKIMHHWLFYSTLGATMDGTFAPSIGTHVGDAAQLFAGWAVGGNDVNMPPDVGLKLPGPGEGMLLEWHFYNASALPEEDKSAVEICTVPAGSLKHTAGMTWLGTEFFNGPAGMPPKVESKFSGTCAPGRMGMTGNEPIRIFSLWPHMHKLGRHMKSVVTRANGMTEEVFNKPFDFNYQVTYDASIDLHPGDTITSTCTFMNTSDYSVAFGPSTEQEMCYQFAFAYPAGALQNGVLSLVGATNTCW
jgi:Copper type II ascorbate-dependent monooxygenase, C-terminal domain